LDRLAALNYHRYRPHPRHQVDLSNPNRHCHQLNSMFHCQLFKNHFVLIMNLCFDALMDVHWGLSIYQGINPHLLLAFWMELVCICRWHVRELQHPCVHQAS